jgi:hypothetical protein
MEVILRIDGHMPAEQLAQLPVVKDALSKRLWFSVAICNGRGETEFSKSNGKWRHRTHRCDQVFGFIRVKWRDLR